MNLSNGLCPSSQSFTAEVWAYPSATVDRVEKHLRIRLGSSKRHTGVGLICRDDGIHKDHLVAKDSSGNSNDLPLVTPPTRQDVQISQARSRTRSWSFDHALVSPDQDVVPHLLEGLHGGFRSAGARFGDVWVSCCQHVLIARCHVTDRVEQSQKEAHWDEAG